MRLHSKLLNKKKASYDWRNTYQTLNDEGSKYFRGVVFQGRCSKYPCQILLYRGAFLKSSVQRTMQTHEC